jgi:hypothetical protein
MDSFWRAEVAQRTRCAPRRDKRRLNWSLHLSFGWNHRSIPAPTTQFIAFVSLANSGTVPKFFTAMTGDSPRVYDRTFYPKNSEEEPSEGTIAICYNRRNIGKFAPPELGSNRLLATDRNVRHARE